MIDSPKDSNTYLQGAYNSLPINFYREAINFIKEGDRICNLGCGIVFKFEREIKKIKKVKITCIDIINIEKKPDFIDDYILQSVEEPFELKNKFNLIYFFELIEHIDKTDMLLINSYKNLVKNGLLIFSFPNLSSIYSRLEILLGLQPHILEVSNILGNFGTGIFGSLNNPKNISIHHIRGITYKGMKELVKYHGFKIEKVIGWEFRMPFLFKRIPSLAPLNIFICRKL